jgi:hypothetical protein
MVSDKSEGILYEKVLCSTCGNGFEGRLWLLFLIQTGHFQFVWGELFNGGVKQ